MVDLNLLKQCGKQTMFVGNFWHAKHVEEEELVDVTEYETVLAVVDSGCGDQCGAGVCL